MIRRMIARGFNLMVARLEATTEVARASAANWRAMTARADADHARDHARAAAPTSPTTTPAKPPLDQEAVDALIDQAYAERCLRMRPGAAPDPREARLRRVAERAGLRALCMELEELEPKRRDDGGVS